MATDSNSSPQPYEGDGPYVFICYSHADTRVADEIRWLQEGGTNVWYDSGITPGSEWSDALARKIEGCGHFLYFISRNSAESEHCRRELNFAQDRRKQILAVQLESFDLPPGLHLSLSNRQIILKHGLSEDEYRSRLYDTLQSIPRQAETPIAQDTVGSDTRKPSIAVLPLDNMSGDTEQEYFSDGMTEEIIVRLSMNSDLTVIARNSTFTYKGKAAKVQEVSRDLGARYVVEGSVRRAGNRIRVTVQMADAATGKHVWAETYNRELEDVFSVQDEIALEIVASLHVKCQEAEIKRMKRTPTENLTAYDLFLRGHKDLYRFTNASMLQAREFFRKAVELDPDYADAIASLGHTYCVDYLLQWDSEPDSLERAYELAKKAVILDDSCWYAHWCLGDIYLSKRQYEKASIASERLKELRPNDAMSHMYYGWFLLLTGKYEEAIVQIRKAIHLNPHPPEFYYSNLGWAYRLSGHYEEAMQSQKRALAINPEHYMIHKELSIVYGELGREEDALDEAMEVVRLAPKFSLEAWGERIPYKDPGQAERDMAALRKAGMK